MPKKSSRKKKAAAKPAKPAKRKGKTVKESQAEYTEVVLPGEANPLGNLLGGRVMHLMDITAAIAVHRHSNSYAATVSVDNLDFRNPVKVGQLVVLKSSVNRVFNTSVEAGVKVFSEDILTGERVHTSSAYLTFVAVDKKGRPKRIAPVVPKTKEEKRRYAEAGRRRRLRLAQRYKGKPKKR
jgi:acyl-CoA hydrolase